MFRGVLRINENPNYLKMHSAGLLYPSTSKQSMHGISERRRKSSQLFALLESKQSNLNHLEKKLHFIILAKNTSSLSRQKSGLKNQTRAFVTTALPSYSSLLHVVGALAGAGGEAVVQRVAEGAHGIGPRPAGETGGGGLVHPAAVFPALPRIRVAVASAAA